MPRKQTSSLRPIALPPKRRRAAAPAVEPLEERCLLTFHFLGDVNPFPAGSEPRDLTAFGGTLFFTAESEVVGRELWALDTNTGEPALVKDIAPGRDHANPSHLTNAAGTLFFTANGRGRATELWRSDETEDGTRHVGGVRRSVQGGMRPPVRAS